MHVFWIIRFTPTSKRPIRLARSSGMVVHPLAAGRSPTEDIFFSLGLLDRESEPFLFASP